uniref:Uncharacterized protein n=1 Tax=Siphoviridae sp. ct9UA16 TaxID=2827793 RepID=A0A8S5TMR3_9CAUD|nr:MAG TPA: hypothetical protein [Siphoviridae sp. ct9UA16]DAQ58451.1 MAG TPA: hypothetical protein [Caudoviricetes sp.]DAZ61007.1 MAG TPA: hypothetical protein [Caudoviricetes sp.]
MTIVADLRQKSTKKRKNIAKTLDKCSFEC